MCQCIFSLSLHYLKSYLFWHSFIYLMYTILFNLQNFYLRQNRSSYHLKAAWINVSIGIGQNVTYLCHKTSWFSHFFLYYFSFLLSLLIYVFFFYLLLNSFFLHSIPSSFLNLSFFYLFPDLFAFHLFFIICFFSFSPLNFGHLFFLYFLFLFYFNFFSDSLF